MGNTPNNDGRDLTLDFVKGILVIVMVMHHIINYFFTASSESLEYFRFGGGSFIFISGYIVSIFYGKKYHLDRANISLRLFRRGLKLLIIFTALNVLINLTGIGNPSKPIPDIEQYLNKMTTIYTSGDNRFAAFQILLPISYVLMLSPFLLLFKVFLKAQIVIILATICCISFFNIDSYNLGLGLVGIAGFTIGLVVNKLETFFFIKNIKVIFFCFIACIYFLKYSNINLMTYIIGIMIILKLFYDLGKMSNLNKQINRAIILFGQYTLVCYIMQIIFLQGLLRMLSQQRWGFGWETVSIFFLTNVFLFGLCMLLEFFRERYKLINKSYKVIFS